MLKLHSFGRFKAYKVQPVLYAYARRIAKGKAGVAHGGVVVHYAAVIIELIEAGANVYHLAGDEIRLVLFGRGLNGFGEGGNGLDKGCLSLA